MSDVFKINANNLHIGDTVTKAEMFTRMINNANCIVKTNCNGYNYQIVSIIEDGE